MHVSVSTACRSAMLLLIGGFFLLLPDQAPAQGNDFPPGSWRQTCSNPRIKGSDDFTADCRTRDGRVVTSRIDLDSCGRNGPIGNNNGQLACERAGGGAWWGQGLPKGSYSQSCRNARIDGRDLLIAECRRQNGNWRNTRLDIDECRGRDIANNNGHLECGGRTYGGSYGQQMPGGSWQQSCRNARILRDDLVAECRQRDGNWRRASLDLDDCRGRQVSNENGRLRCDTGPWWGQGLPKGSYSQSCRNARIDGRDLLIAECRRQNGNWRNTRLDINECRGRDIANNNGHLECGGRTYGGSYGQQMPAGSWQQSCRNARIQRDDLIAECRGRDGSWQRTSLDLDDCRGRQVSNENGRLRCDAQGGWQGGGRPGGGAQLLPAGTWQQSCRNGQVRDNRLSAECRRQNGNWNTDTLDLRNCNGRPVSNQNGELRC